MRTRVRAIMFGVSAAAAVTAGCQTADRPGRDATFAPLPTAVAMTAKPAAEAPIIAAADAAAPAAGQPLTIAALEQLALANNPTLAQAAAYIEAARGKALQAGLPLNPTVGITGEQIGANNKAGEWTFFSLQQQIVTGGKLQLSRRKYEVEAELAEIQAHAQQLRVVNGLAVAYFDVLAAQRSVENDRRVAENATEAEKVTQQLLNLGQANQQDLLQAEVEASQARIAVRTAEARLRQVWVHLATLVGVPDLPPQKLAGELEPAGPALAREETLARLLQDSPEVAFAAAKVRQDQVQLERERREWVPNVTVRGGVGYDYDTRSPTAQVGISLPIPIHDQNQGTVRQAAADLARSQAEVTRVQLDLRRRFADAFTRYDTAREEVENFRDQLLPKAKKAEELYAEQFKARRAAFPQVLVARRAVYQLSDEYNKSLVQFHRAEVEVRGLLLVDGLAAPSNPTPPGHIGATPKPR